MNIHSHREHCKTNIDYYKHLFAWIYILLYIKSINEGHACMTILFLYLQFYVCILFLVDALFIAGAFYGPGSGSILLRNVGCVGTEQRLIDCPYSSSVTCRRGHYEDVGVRCQSK